VFLTNMYVWPSEAHNGYLDVINEIGFIGGAGLIGYLFVFLRQCLALIEIDRSQAALYISLLFSELIFNLSEAHWWNLANVYFFIMTLATFGIAKSMVVAKAARTPRMTPDPGRQAGPDRLLPTAGVKPARPQRSRAFG
jgi:O-antigen ligase